MIPFISNFKTANRIKKDKKLIAPKSVSKQEAPVIGKESQRASRFAAVCCLPWMLITSVLIL